METFDLSRLTDFDFEAVCKDIFEAEYGFPLEIFSPGADAGIDLRYLHAGGSELVVQCKHWVRSPRSKLVAYIRDIESRKVKKLRPSRYVLATSAELTKDAKDKIYKALTPYVTTPSDIYGRHELDALLRKHENIVRRHLRLWLTSASVLSSLLHKSILTRSRQLANDLDTTLRTYAPNESYARAAELLEARHSCVIAGIPGIGKTTLAHVLCAKYVSASYELIEVSSDLEEANALWDDDVPQIFYYDDFLGQTALEEKLGKNEDSRLLSLMRRVATARNKRFVLTTREYILAQARQRYEKLDRHRFDLHTCVVDIADYTYRTRGEILYNHIYMSGLSRELKERFADPRVYLPIIRHPNFNPRIIAATVAEAELLSSDPEDVDRRIIENLHSPRSIWSHIVNHQLKEAEVHLLELIFSVSRDISFQDVQEIWTSLDGSLRQLRHSISILEGTMVRTYRKSSKVFLGFHNPSVRDFMRDYLLEEQGGFLSLIRRFSHFEQVENILITVSVRAEALQLFMANKALLEEAATRSYDSPGLHDDGVNRSVDLAHRARVYLHLGEVLDSEVILDCAHRMLDEDDAIDNAYDPHDVVEIVQILHGANRQSLRRMFPDALQAAMEWIKGDLSSWPLLASAKSFFEELSGIVPESEVQEIEDRMQAEAQDLIRGWSEEGPDSMSDHSIMEDVLAYASEYANPEEIFDGYAEAVAQMPYSDWDEPEFNRREVGSSDSCSSLLEESRAVASMMESLRDDD
ncbi:restriction endonuclease [Streptomyces sp. CAI-85]|uniref:nSTAND3 domain-containing NTPase n=1 Tax=Streptomyces sp. CAI-85 TaxID=1472662 RepID=UPI001587CD40|nr:restriction endonuclease [Streptomyces sp. CAI-85]NUV60824.1 restriction endonuclease [Streptomyces sp. CAI-85]